MSRASLRSNLRFLGVGSVFSCLRAASVFVSEKFLCLLPLVRLDRSLTRESLSILDTSSLSLKWYFVRLW